MSLQDHFHPPLSVRRHWNAFHNSWATYLSSHLNERLPEGYFAEANVHFCIEIDVATLDENGTPPGATSWSPPEPHQSLALVLTDTVVEINVFGQDGGPTLAGAIELVSPANKDRPAHRAAFVSKCAALIQQGIGVVLVDVVTERHANLHAELILRLGAQGTGELSALYAAAYRPVERAGKPELDVWYELLALGRPLPTLPLWLRGGLCLPVELQVTYERTCREQRLLLPTT